MADEPIEPGSDAGAPPPPRPPHVRRPRYRGTHPRSFRERYKERDPERFPETAEHVRAQGRTPAGTHVPILVAEVLEATAPAPGETVADLTVGYGGHARELAARVGATGRLLAFDHDEATLAATAARWPALGLAARTTFHAVHHAALADVLAAEGIDGCDVVLADLGVSSMQIDDPERGFSYRRDGPLDMRMDRRRRRTAADVLATIGESALSEALADLSDEPHAERIAAAIVAARATAPIATTRALADAVFAAVGTTRERWKARARVDPGEPHPAARTFQTLRILVNDEMAGLERLLRGLPWCLRPGGRVAILSFHSGEDRRVKRAFRDGLDAGLYEAVADEVVRAGPQETAANPRASSAKLRWARRAAIPADPRS
jgi:16S rRNA (cytosine1402-N4)-methyltransferase